MPNVEEEANKRMKIALKLVADDENEGNELEEIKNEI